MRPKADGKSRSLHFMTRCAKPARKKEAGSLRVGMTAIASKSRLEAGARTCWAHAEAYPTERSQQWVSHRLLFLVVPGEAAVDEEGGACGVRGFVGGEENGHRSDIFGLAEALQRNVFEKRAEFCRVV